MPSKVLFNEESQDKILKGINIAANAVKETLGPRGRTVIISQPQYGSYRITKDGVTVARAIHLPDNVEQLGAMIIRDAGEKTVSQCGDGTTTSAVLTQALCNEGDKLIKAGANPVEVKKSIEKSVRDVCNYIRLSSTPIAGDWKKVEQVATVSLNGDCELGALIAKTMEKIGQYGAITVQEDHNSRGTSVEVVEGMQFDNGWMSAYFVNNAQKMTCELDNPYILIHDRVISDMGDIIPILEQLAKEKRPLLVIAATMDGQAYQSMIANKMEQGWPLCAVNAPGIGDERKFTLQDIATLTRGIVISEDFGHKLSKVSLDMLGTARKVIISKTSTTIIDGSGDKDAITDRINEITEQISKEKDGREAAILERRRAKLSSGIAIIHVGGTTETEMKERRDRCDDAVGAVKAALLEGISAGGGVCYLQAIGKVGPSSIVSEALMAPFIQMMKNAGLDYEITIAGILNGGPQYNISTEQHCDMIEEGIIDPSKTLICALENAASVAALVLTSNVSITIENDLPNKK